MKYEIIPFMVLTLFLSCRNEIENMSNVNSEEIVEEQNNYYYDPNHDSYNIGCLGKSYIATSKDSIFSQLHYLLDSEDFYNETATLEYTGKYLFIIYYDIHLNIKKVKIRRCYNENIAIKITEELKKIKLKSIDPMGCELGVITVTIGGKFKEDLYYNDGSQIEYPIL